MSKSPIGTGSSDPRVAFFDRLASRWDEHEQDPAETIARLEDHRDLLSLQSGHDLIEVGCGTGQITGWLAAQVAPGQVTAIDFSAAMLDIARGKGVAAEFVQADICRDELPAGCCDVALCFHSFPHFADQAAALRNLSGALRPNGRLLVMHLLSRDEINGFHDHVGGEVDGDHLPCDRGWPILLDQAGMEMVRQIDHEGLYFLQARKQR